MYAQQSALNYIPSKGYGNDNMDYMNKGYMPNPNFQTNPYFQNQMNQYDSHNMALQSQYGTVQPYVYDPMNNTSIANPNVNMPSQLQQFNGMTNNQFSGYGENTINGWLGEMQKQNIDINTMGNQAIGDSLANYNNNQLAINRFKPTALDWGKFALQGIGQAFSMYSNYKQMKLADKNFKEMQALNRANYRNSAKAMNAQYRNRMSGRGHIGMTSEAKRALGREYDNRKVNESY